MGTRKIAVWGGMGVSPLAPLPAHRPATLRAENIFTYSCGTATKIRITNSAWLNLYTR